jgi:hypothetical protein
MAAIGTIYGLQGIGTLIALSFIQDPEVIHEPQRCPATETWRQIGNYEGKNECFMMVFDTCNIL